jgi:hypothetical protein
MKRNFGLLAFVGLVLVMSQWHWLAAQVVTEEPAVVSPTYVAVPARQQEVITTAPSPQYVWVSGQWERTPSSWSWTAGRWVQPPFSNAYYVPGYWKHNSGHFVWQPAHWAAAAQGVVVQKPVTVPPLYAEAQPAAPANVTSVVWQPGYWDWRGTWVWVPGEYVQSTAARATWVPGAWESTVAGTWRWNPAHWAVA